MRFIKLYTEIINWEWYTEPVVFRVFMHLLITANFGFSKWKGYDLRPGQLIIGRKKLANELELSEKQIRLALIKLKKTGEISVERARHFSIITICNWPIYQSPIKGEGPEKGPVKGRQRATVIENKNNKEEEFDRFWNLYGKKTGKKKCVQLWSKLSLEDISEILEHVPKYVKSKPDKQFRKDPATYLAGEHWNDEVLEQMNAEVKQPVKQATGMGF